MLLLSGCGGQRSMERPDVPQTARYPSGPRERSAKPPFVGSNPTRASTHLRPGSGGSFRRAFPPWQLGSPKAWRRRPSRASTDCDQERVSRARFAGEGQSSPGSGSPILPIMRVALLIVGSLCPEQAWRFAMLSREKLRGAEPAIEELGPI